MLVISLLLVIAGFFYLLRTNKAGSLLKPASCNNARFAKELKSASLSEALKLLKNRKDKEALVIFEKVLNEQGDNLDAMWGKAEVLRRTRRHKEAESILNEILRKNPKYPSALICLSHIRYKEDRLKEAQNLAQNALLGFPARETQAMAYVMLGAINGKRSSEGSFLNKIRYGMQVKRYFLKAKELSQDLPEAHLGLGSFYLLAPSIAGGNLIEAFKELEVAVKLAPDFATANARLAQAYKKKGNLEKFNFYIRRARELDPENEVLKEIK